MDFYFEDGPCSSESNPKNGHGESQMTEDSNDLPRGKSSSVGITEFQEQHNRYPHEAIPVGITEFQGQHTSSNIDDISRRVQDLVEKINNSRTSDQKVMDSFQEKLVEKVTEMLQQMKEHMYTVYEENSNVMQVKLQELSEVLESCSKLNKELMEASQALKSLREGLAIIQTPQP
ncbi:synaptonemal complex central element protein 2 [Cheilinus undulatus]|uniref:synaptonemal complex central element protein 2 n=1 Tax=Cheilinus undulatus TaxID=241271 RepID=UPI001BD1E8BC|nr:synaptonemal complex central element protein 2 [Cheilinus undulatus]XP_041641875.1 synaptonemal complex central element protein 2 [Cheilinus undulatus]XP_041641876.1 synaptonemal complex central element protein 2 [Cheilinus undulatus]XP_041641877.1 synaptonemal complex central element protein 2 [Cheilinus undulatus]XP_041641878.1 synaptonemal complex central element protein 2 [Cheilinus undulatus]XP_041641880.1 synaptonemal complex central element protein 2 [Cheilinus undulatus]